jgi:hypothetical protein
MIAWKECLVKSKCEGKNCRLWQFSRGKKEAKDLGADQTLRTWGAAVLRPYTRLRSGAPVRWSPWESPDGSGLGKTRTLLKTGGCGTPSAIVAESGVGVGTGCGWGDTRWMKGWAIGVEGIGVRDGWRDCRSGSAKRVVEQMLSFAWLGGAVSRDR